LLERSSCISNVSLLSWNNKVVRNVFLLLNYINLWKIIFEQFIRFNLLLSFYGRFLAKLYSRKSGWLWIRRYLCLLDCLRTLLVAIWLFIINYAFFKFFKITIFFLIPSILFSTYTTRRTSIKRVPKLDLLLSTISSLSLIIWN
jgi:hypothetical protein